MSPTLWRPALAELVGTFIFFFIGAGSIVADQWLVSHNSAGIGLIGVALAHGLVLSLMVSATGAISGGHLNPAVTISFWLTRRIETVTAIAYIVAQLIGGIIAGLVLRAIFPDSVWQPVHLGTPAVAPEVSFGTAVLVEAVLTFILVFCIFGTAVDDRAPRSIAGFGIGLAILIDILVGGPLTGASMNPARTFGPAVASGFWDNHLVYWIGPIVGGGLAALLYEYAFIKSRVS